MASVYDEELKAILFEYTGIDDDELVEKIKDNFVTRLSPYIGDDFDQARRVISA